jgi:hypothetical protein
MFIALLVGGWFSMKNVEFKLARSIPGRKPNVMRVRVGFDFPAPLIEIQPKMKQPGNTQLRFFALRLCP